MYMWSPRSRSPKTVASSQPSRAHTVGTRIARAFSAKEGAKEARSDEYSKAMDDTMGANATIKGKRLVYDHEEGMNYDLITDDIIVGSCLQVPEDADRLKAAGVKLVVCLQQDTDLAYFDLDIEPIQERCKEIDLRHVRLRINDMDPLSLRLRLPDVIKNMHHQVTSTPPGITYVHCTAGMGRAPAVALAYMWWVQGKHLEDANANLVSKRWCAPALWAIRQAAADILYTGTPQDITIKKKGTSNSKVVEIAGLDVGWGGRLKMQKGTGDTWSVTRALLPGVYPFKYVMDGVWSYDMDQYTVVDGFNVNNVVEVLPTGLSPIQNAARTRVLKSGGKLTDEEAAKIREAIGVATSKL